MSLGGIMIQNYKLYGYFIMAASAVAGSIFIGLPVFFLLRKQISGWLSPILKHQNRQIMAESSRLIKENLALRSEVAELRADYMQARIKCAAAASTITSAFSLDSGRSNNE